MTVITEKNADNLARHRVRGLGFWVAVLHWTRLLWPFVFTVGGGAALFGSAIIGTIRSTDHPVLVYLIFSAALAAVFASCFALHIYLREADVAMRWMGLADEEKIKFLGQESGGYIFSPVLRLLAPGQSQSRGDQHSLISAELDIAQDQLDSKLELPNFIGGALVGLGLVGTFVGLLSTLDDLSHVFSALVNSGYGSASPTQMFSDMVSKLQAPMKGMGTAFVASLYGLLGSLMITMMMVGANKTSAFCIRQYFLLVRKSHYGYRDVGGPRDTSRGIPVLVDAVNSQPNNDLQELRKAVVQLVEQVNLERGRYDTFFRRSNETVIHIANAVRSLSEQQGKLQEQIHVDLDHVRRVLQAEHANLLTALQISKRDSFETIKAIEACRQSFDSGARNLNIVLSYLSIGEDKKSPSSSNSKQA